MTRAARFIAVFAAHCVLSTANAGAALPGGPMSVTVAARPSFGSETATGREERARLHLRAGTVLLSAGHPGRAALEFGESVHFDPGAANYRALGAAYEQAGNRLKAAWAYRESLRFDDNPRIRALADALSSGTTPGVQARYRGLLTQAALEAESGAAGPAMRDYRIAFRIHAAVESARPCLVLAAAIVGRDLKSGSLDAAVETLCEIRALRDYLGARGVAKGTLEDLNRSEERAVRWSGRSLADNRKAMLADRAAWIAGLRGRAALGERGH